LQLTERRAEGRIEFTYEMIDPEVAYPLQGHELSMGIVVRILRLLGGPQARPSAISLIHSRQGPTTAYAQALDCPVRFGQSWCGFQLTADLSEQRIENADPETRRIATAYLESTYLPVTASLSARVAELTRRLLPTGQCGVDAVAAALALHPRTLQRRLALEGTRCQDVIDRERRAQAALYLAEPDLRISHIAGLLGYSEQSTLNRSCRRWFGKTPKQCRDEGGPVIP
jgi:AraC-like DNA-binding protein